MMADTTGQQAEPQLWIARQHDGRIAIHDAKPVQMPGSDGWFAINNPDGASSLVGIIFTADSQKWPKSFLPMGKNGCRRLIIDYASVVSATGASISASTESGTAS